MPRVTETLTSQRTWVMAGLTFGGFLLSAASKRLIEGGQNSTRDWPDEAYGAIVAIGGAAVAPISVAIGGLNWIMHSVLKRAEISIPMPSAPQPQTGGGGGGQLFPTPNGVTA